jgi:Cu+-exporting ATPase
MRAAAAGLSGTTQKDPVCNMDVDEGKATTAGKTSDYGGRKYYFCSEGCKQQFDKDPGHFLKSPSPDGKQKTVTTAKKDVVREASVHKDIICGMDVEEHTAEAAGRTSEYHGKKYYFCSDSCKQRFEKDPERGGAGEEERHLINHIAAGGGND